MSELKACPFCGDKAERFECEETDNRGGDVIGCKKCEASTRVFFGEKVGLIEAWNTRPAPERHNELREALENARHRIASTLGLVKGNGLEKYIMPLYLEETIKVIDAALAEQAAPVKEGE